MINTRAEQRKRWLKVKTLDFEFYLRYINVVVPLKKENLCSDEND